MNHTLRDMLRQATRLTVAGRLNEATKAIQSALSGAARPREAPGDPSASEEVTVIDSTAVVIPEESSPVPAGSALDVGVRTLVAAPTVIAETPAGLPRARVRTHEAYAPPRLGQHHAEAADLVDPGEFTAGTHTHASLLGGRLQRHRSLRRGCPRSCSTATRIKRCIRATVRR